MPRRSLLLLAIVLAVGPGAVRASAQQAAEAVAPIETAAPAAAAAPVLEAPLPALDQRPLRTTGAQARRLQRALGVRVDGVLGRRSQAALRRWERREGLLADGLPDPEVLGRLGIDLTGAQIAGIAPPPVGTGPDVLYGAVAPA